MVDEKQKSCSLAVVVGIARETFRFETVLLVSQLKIDQLIGNRAVVNDSNPVFDASCYGYRNAGARFAVLLASESHALAVNSVFAYLLHDLRILLAGRPESSTARWDVVEEIFDLCIISLVTTSTLSVLLTVI